MALEQSASLPAGKVYSPLGAWSALDMAWTSALGYRADEFRFVVNSTPLSTLWETSAIIFVYLIVVFGGRQILRNRKPLAWNGLFKLHNLFLTIVSGALLVLFLEQVVPTLLRDGFYENICGADGWTPPLVTLYYVSLEQCSTKDPPADPRQLNYITKYIELLDTVFLMLRRKPLTFLHCYHHPATALLCYSQLAGRTSVSWVPITLNLAVHVVMYWYYFQSARGVKIWWKEWITRLQIAQFVIDLCKDRLAPTSPDAWRC
jgi:hypothetical protein